MSVLTVIESRIDLRLLQKVLLGLGLSVLVAIPIDLTMTWMGRGRTNAVTSSSDAEKASEVFESQESFEEAFQRSKLFGYVQGQANLPVLAASINELTKDYRLKGVVLLDEPEAIIEDARTQKATFMRVGDKLGEVSIKTIQEGLVVLTYYGEEKEMRLQ